MGTDMSGMQRSTSVDERAGLPRNAGLSQDLPPAQVRAHFQIMHYELCGGEALPSGLLEASCLQTGDESAMGRAIAHHLRCSRLPTA